METILSVSGKPGLYKLVSRGKMNLIVETIDAAHRRTPVFATDKVTSLSDIATYTDADDVPLRQVHESVGKKEGSKKAAINYKKCPAQELRDYFAEVLPSYDRDRVHDSDIKKLLQWYNILVENGYTDFKALLSMEEEEATEADSKASEEQEAK